MRANETERLGILNNAKLLPGLSDGMSQMITIACILFDEKVPLMQRVQFLSHNPLAAKIAIGR